MEGTRNSRDATPTSARLTPSADRMFAVPQNLKGLMAVFLLLLIVAVPISLVYKNPFLYALVLALIGVFIYLYRRVDESATSQARVMCRTLSQEQIMDKMKSHPDSVDPHVRSRTMKMLNQPKSRK